MAKNKITISLAVLAAGGLAVMFIQQKTVEHLRAENTRLASQALEADRLRAEHEKLLAAQINPDELARMRAAQGELLKLRGEAGLMRQQLRRAGSGGPAAISNAKAADTATDPTNAPPAFSANVVASVENGHTLLTGGWTTPSGKRCVVLLTPQINSTADGASTVTVGSWWIEAPEEVLARAGLAGFKSAGSQSDLKGVMTPQQAAALLEAMKQSGGVDILSAPRITTADGRQAQISSMNPGSGGTGPATGVQVDIVPQVAADGKSVQLSVAAQLSLPTHPDSNDPTQPVTVPLPGAR